MKDFLETVNPFTDDDGYINAESNQEILSRVWQEVFHLLDAIPREVADLLDAGRLASTVQNQLELSMLRTYLRNKEGK